MMFIRCMVLKIEADRAVRLYRKIILLKLLVDEIKYVKQLYFRNDAMYNIKTCTVELLSVCTFPTMSKY